MTTRLEKATWLHTENQFILLIIKKKRQLIILLKYINEENKVDANTI